MRKNQQVKTLGADPLTYQYVNFIVYERMNGKMSKMSYEEAKMLCEKAQEKSRLASQILKKNPQK